MIVDSFERGRKPTFTRPTLERTHDDPEGGPKEKTIFFLCFIPKNSDFRRIFFFFFCSLKRGNAAPVD